jgi:gallate decarboxylase subunit C
MSNDKEQAKADHPLGWNVPNIHDLWSAIKHIKNFNLSHLA